MQVDNQENRGGPGGEHLDEGRVHAWLDGALDSAEAASVQRHVESCGDCASMVAEARGLVAASSRILRSLDDERSSVVRDAAASVSAAFAAVEGAGERVGAGKVAVENEGAVPGTDGARKGDIGKRRPGMSAWQWRLAAGFLVVAGASALLLRGADPTQFMERSPATSAALPDTVAAKVAAQETTADAAGRDVPETPVAPSPPASTDTADSRASALSAESVISMAPERPATAPTPAPSPLTISSAPPAAPPTTPGAVADRPTRTDSAAQPPPPPSEVAPMADMQSRAARPPQAAARSQAGYAPESAPLAAVATPRVVRGEVRSADLRQPIAGAAVHVAGAPAGVVTDSVGRFALPVSRDDSLATVYASGFVPTQLAITDSLLRDSALVLLERDVDGSAQRGLPAAPQAVMLEAWLAPDVPPEDGRVASAAGCWALVDGRVPGASEGVLLRLHADYGGERTWQPLHLESVEEVDSLLVRLAGAVELRLQLQGDRLSGVSQRAGPAGTAGIMVEFARVRCDDVR